MTEQQAELLGFVFEKQYHHDHYVTNRFKKGSMQIEFTYNKKGIETVDLTMEEINCMEIDYDKLKKLTEIFE